MLGEQRVGSLAVLHRGGGAPGAGGAERRPVRGALIGHQGVGDVVHQRGNGDVVDRFQVEQHAGVEVGHDVRIDCGRRCG